MQKRIFDKRFLLLSAALLICGCESASIEAPSGFLNDYSVLQEGKYFKQEYVAPGVNFSEYKSVKVTPIDFDYLADKTVCGSDKLENLDRDFRSDIEARLREKGFEITPSPGGKTLVLSVSVTNIELPNAAINAAAAVFCPVPLPLDTDGATAFEAKVTDGTTGNMLIEFAEKQSGSGEGLDIAATVAGSYVDFVNTKAVFKGWSKKIAQMLGDLKSGTTKGKKGGTSSGSLLSTGVKSLI